MIWNIYQIVGLVLWIWFLKICKIQSFIHLERVNVNWFIQPSIPLAYSSISSLQNITFWEISICGQGQRRTACLNVTPVWTAKGSILRLSKLELAVMQCHYSRKTGQDCWGTVQNATLGELKSFYLSKLNAVRRKYWAQCPFPDLLRENINVS